MKLKNISKRTIPQAQEKALRYRLLNHPWLAESICRDILEIDPDNQETIYTLILAITDQYENKYRMSVPESLKVVSKLKNPYQHDYCKGIIYERQAAAALKRANPRSGYIAYEYLEQAMYWYEKAEKIKPEDNDESILRWNACVRMIKQNKLKPAPEQSYGQSYIEV